MGHTFHHVDIR